MVNLNSLISSFDRRPRRLGRGHSTSKGKTCGRGHKGQRCRSGGNSYVLEGGQTPIHRRLPKHGFKPSKGKQVKTISLSLIASRLIGGGLYPAKMLKSIFKIKSCCFIKILNGEISIKGLILGCDLASDSAISKINKLNGCICLSKLASCQY